MKRNGFTLIEVIITVTIFTIVITAVYGVFYMGIKTWYRGQEDKELREVRLGFLEIEKELKQSFFFSGIPFEGTTEEIVFPLSISEGDTDNLCIIRYNVDRDDESGLKYVTRREETFSGSSGGSDEKDKILLPLVKSVKFEYAHRLRYPLEGFIWREHWDGAAKGELPSGVRVSLEMDDSEEVYNKIVFLRHKDFKVE